jgi:hypothetical protein
MTGLSPSALITDQGRRVSLRIRGRHFELSQEELRGLLGLPPGLPGLGITIDSNRFCFEFPADHKSVELSTEQLQRRLSKQLTNKA